MYSVALCVAAGFWQAAQCEQPITVERVRRAAGELALVVAGISDW